MPVENALFCLSVETPDGGGSWVRAAQYSSGQRCVHVKAQPNASMKHPSLSKVSTKIAVVSSEQTALDKPSYHVPKNSAKFLVEKGVCEWLTPWVIRTIKGAKVEVTPKLPAGRQESNVPMYQGACEICGFSRFVEQAHIIPSRFGGSTEPHNMLDLCPNHHRLFDRNLLTKDEFSLIQEKIKKIVGLATADPLLYQWKHDMSQKYDFELAPNEVEVS